MKITGPTLLLDKSKCLANIRSMSEKAGKAGVIFRPHFKTHQSQVVGGWFKDFGVSAITVSSTDMAIYFAAGGWKDITIAFPFNPRDTERIKELSSSVRLNLLFSDPGSARLLGKSLDSPVGFFIEIDTGYHRSGFSLDDYHEILGLADDAARFPNLVFKGFLSHFGNTYKETGKAGIKRIYKNSLEQLLRLKHALSAAYPGIIISVGDTPSCSVMDDFGGADEIRPGNFVFYDVMQAGIGSCSTDQISVCMAVPVVAKNRQRNEIIIHGGAVHLSKEFIHQDGKDIFGLVTQVNPGGWGTPLPGCAVTSLSQEHGVVRVTPDIFNSLETGDLLGILPIHSCLSVSCMKRYFTLEGEMISCL